MALINFSGIASGIDSTSLIGAILDQQRKARVAPLKDRIDSLTKTNSSFDDLSGLLGDLKSAAYTFRSINGGAIAKTTSSSDETVATATATPGAQSGSYAINVTQLAQGATYSFADRYSSTTALINGSINNGATAADRTVSVTVGRGSSQESVSVQLTNTTTASEFVSQFNAASSHAEASLVNVGSSSSPSYAIVISSNESGLDDGEVSVSVGSEIQTAGTGAFITASSTVSQAKDAQFTLSGISGSITRGTNEVSDIIPGLSISLADTGSATISVAPNAESTKGAVKKFVDSFNEVIKYIQTNDAVSQQNDGGNITNIFGSLSGTSVDENVVSQLRNALLSSTGGGSTVNTLADLGITTQRDGTLSFNETTFKDAFSTDSVGTGTLLEGLGENLASVGGLIDQFTRFNGIIGSVKNGNLTDINNLQNRISDIEESLAKQEQSLTQQFSRLEGVIGKLQQQQNSLGSLLPR